MENLRPWTGAQLRLQLTNQRITDAGPARLPRLPKVMSLHLGDTAVTAAGLKHLHALPALERLSLGKPPITDAAPAELHGRKLTLLGLRNCDGLTDATLTTLDALDLGNVPITDAGLAKVMALPKLGHLDLTGTRVTPARLPDPHRPRPGRAGDAGGLSYSGTFSRASRRVWPRLRTAISSATMLTAISGTVCDPIANPSGAWTFASASFEMPRASRSS